MDKNLIESNVTDDIDIDIGDDPIEMYDLSDILNNIQSRGLTTNDIKLILNRMFDRKNIDMSTRIRDVELDAICNMLHHGHQLTLMMQKDLKTNIKFELESYVLQNLSLRLSLDSQSRNEIVSIFTKMIHEESQALETHEKEVKEVDHAG